jgi:hypothetical protein
VLGYALPTQVRVHDPSILTGGLILTAIKHSNPDLPLLLVSQQFKREVEATDEFEDRELRIIVDLVTKSYCLDLLFGDSDDSTSEKPIDDRQAINDVLTPPFRALRIKVWHSENIYHYPCQQTQRHTDVQAHGPNHQVERHRHKMW